MARQAIKYQRTTVPPARSAQEIGRLVQEYGARRFALDYGTDGRLQGVEFWLIDPDLGPSKPVPVRLRAKTQTIVALLRAAKVPTGGQRFRLHTEIEQERERIAERIAWRQLKDFVEQALLAAKTGLFSTGQAFMAHVLLDTPEGSLTVGEYFAEHAAQVTSRGVQLLPARSEDGR